MVWAAYAVNTVKVTPTSGTLASTTSAVLTSGVAIRGLVTTRGDSGLESSSSTVVSRWPCDARCDRSPVRPTSGE